MDSKGASHDAGGWSTVETSRRRGKGSDGDLQDDRKGGAKGSAWDDGWASRDSGRAGGKAGGKAAKGGEGGRGQRAAGKGRGEGVKSWVPVGGPGAEPTGGGGAEGAQARSWAYVDPHGEVQVGFSSEDMRDWYKGGYFPEDLRVALVPGKAGSEVAAPPTQEFRPLRQWFPDAATAFTFMPNPRQQGDQSIAHSG